MAMDINRQTGAGSEKTVDSLNSLLRGELSAVETYRQALEKVTDPSLASTLRECQSAHQERVQRLRQLVSQCGGKPSDGSGPWGAFAKLIEGGARLFGDKAAIAALEEGEDHGLRDYRDECPKLDASVRSVVEGELLAGQERTHRTMSNLKHNLERH
jgi:uncharacterized protein (TIGR02284 family)